MPRSSGTDALTSNAGPAPGLPSVRECIILVLIVASACALRAAWPGRMAVEHFDEGIYASNLYCGHLDPEYAYPDRPLYAPPFLPAVLEWILLLSGNPHSVMWVNVIAGTLTALAVWWVTRAWFGPAAALAAAMLAATSEFHIAFSRMALTDVLLCLWMLLGVYAGWKAVLSGRPLWIGVAGLLAGMAWCTKYNGWLTLAVTASGTSAWLVMARPTTVRWWQAAARWLGSAAVAGVLFWFVAVRPLGPEGYAAVNANHARYLVGLPGWWSGLMRQLDVHSYINAWVTCAGVGVAGLIAWGLMREQARGWRRHWLSGGPMSVLPGLMAIGGAMSFLLIFAGVFLCGAAVVRCRTRLGVTPGTKLAVWISSAWFLGLVVAVPLYYPYPRLSLPILMICWLGVALALSTFPSGGLSGEHLEQPDTQGSPKVESSWLSTSGLALFGVVFLLGFAYWLGRGRGTPFDPPMFVAWEDHGGVSRRASEMLQVMRSDLESRLPSADPDLDAVIYVYADPAAFYHVASDAARQAPRVLVHPAGNLGMTEPGATRRPVAGVYLVTGPRAHRDKAALEAVSNRLELIGRFAYQASALVLLDEYPPEALREQPLHDEELRLYRVVIAE